jgi:dihydrofolate reductase
MRRVRYCVAMSLDAYIADSKGGADWIIHDPDIDFADTFNQFDTFLIGRHTFESMVRAGRSSVPGMKIYVFSRTLQSAEYPHVTIVANQPEKVVQALRAEPGKDIWLFGGGALFASLLSAGLVDTVEVSIVPVLLGGGIPFLPPSPQLTRLRLTDHKIYKNSGIISLRYAVT